MSQIVSQNSRDNSSNRRVTQDDTLSTLTVSNNCLLPCVDERINSLTSSLVTNATTNPYLVSEVTINRDELFNTAPVIANPAVPTFDYPSTVTVSPQGQPNPNEGLITLVPAPGPNKLIAPQIFEIIAPNDPDTSASYEPELTGPPGIQAPNLIFQLSNRYPTKTDNQDQIGGEQVFGPTFEDNTNPGGGGPNIDVNFTNELQFSKLSMEDGIPLIADLQFVNNFQLSSRFSGPLPIPGTGTGNVVGEIKLQTGTYPFSPAPGPPVVRGFDFSPVNQPVTLYVDQPLIQNKGRDFTIRVHYNIVPAS